MCSPKIFSFYFSAIAKDLFLLFLFSVPAPYPKLIPAPKSLTSAHKVDHTWIFIQWYVVSEKACCRAPRTTKLKHCRSYLSYSFTIDDDCFYYHSWRNNVVIAFGTLSSLYLTTRRATVRRHGALLRAAVQAKTRIIYIIIEYLFTNMCSVTSAATVWRQDALPRAAFPPKKTF